MFLVKVEDNEVYARLTTVLGTTKTDWHIEGVANNKIGRGRIFFKQVILLYIDPVIGAKTLRHYDFQFMEVE